MNMFDDWAKAKPFIEKAIEYCKGTHTIDDVALLVGSGYFKLWVGKNFAMLTEFNHYPRVKALNLWGAGGDLTELVDMEQDLIKYARENGCQKITAAGRPGWAKVLPGAQKWGVTMYRDIDPCQA